MPDLPMLLPIPGHVTRTEGEYALESGRLIVLPGEQAQPLHFTASRVRQALLARGLAWQIAAGWAIPAGQFGLTLRIDPTEMPHAQGYRLVIAQTGMQIIGHDAAGVFYGVCTLVQLLAQAEDLRLPALCIEDWPDFPARGVMLDISRDKVPTLSTLYALIDRLAGWKVNQVQLYTEHTFAYRNHPQVWDQASPITGEEILALDVYCRERFIELVPNQNSFGHMERWLKHPRYAPLAEIHGDFMSPWGPMVGPFGLAPEHPGSLELVDSLFDELLPHFSSRQFNVGCDETIDLGQGQSKAIVQAQGAGRVYLDFLQKIYRSVKRRGYTMQFWGDIIVQHPELVPELPGDMIAMSWGYEADHPFDKEGAQFAAAGVPFYVCPGTSSWNTLAGRTDNTLGNLLNAAENGLKWGACGFLNTDWGDNGHWQMLPFSYLGLAAGAAYSWGLQANRSLDVPQTVSRFAFDDPTGTMGRVAFDLGNIYQETGVPLHNSSALFWILQRPLQWLVESQRLDAAGLTASLESIEQAMSGISAERMICPDAGLITREFNHTARLLRHACRRGLLGLHGGEPLRRQLANELEELVTEQQALWLERNRPGGLTDSLARFDPARKDYTQG